MDWLGNIFGNKRSGWFLAVMLVVMAFAVSGCAMRATGNDNTENGDVQASQQTDQEADKLSEYIIGDGEENGQASAPASNNDAAALNDQQEKTEKTTNMADEDPEGQDTETDGNTEADPEEEIAEEEEPHYIVVFDPGHGGRWAGACYIGLTEKELTLKVANYARDYLLENYDNIDVYLTRETDDPLDKDLKNDLRMRCDMAADLGATCLVSIHFNATDAHTLSGTEIWCSRRSNVHDQTFELGGCIMKEFVAIGLQERSVSSRKSNDTFDESGRAMDYYAINRYCAARDLPGIIVEQCFMDSEHDQQFITSEEGLKKLGEANARGVAAYFDILTERAKTEKEAENENSGDNEAQGTGTGEAVQ
ncbi:MAG: N-acetylmuramoyl-L-alanine amidase [Lachnospiraceae bacterium]|nr:N-acetylmuramoyl-L-alanine amidase [Lachnospiraceae bacterium]